MKLISKILLSLVVQLITEKFIKELIVLALSRVVKKTENKMDDKLLAQMISEWNK